MKVTTKFFMLALILSLMLTVSAVAAAEDISFDKSDTKNTNKNLLSTYDGKENLKTNEKTLNDETLSAKPDNNKLGDGQFTYSELRSQIGDGRNITLNKGTYTYAESDDGTIEIKNVNLQPIIGLIMPPTSEAKITPTGAPDCMKAPNLALNLSGNVSLI